jgi:hypothetical protein
LVKAIAPNTMLASGELPRKALGAGMTAVMMVKMTRIQISTGTLRNAST